MTLTGILASIITLPMGYTVPGTFLQMLRYLRSLYPGYKASIYLGMSKGVYKISGSSTLLLVQQTLGKR